MCSPANARDTVLVGDHVAPHAPRGRIELVTFLGPLTRLDVRIDGDAEPILVVVVSAAALHLQIGQSIAVLAPPDAIRMYA